MMSILSWWRYWGAYEIFFHSSVIFPVSCILPVFPVLCILPFFNLRRQLQLGSTKAMACQVVAVWNDA